MLAVSAQVMQAGWFDFATHLAALVGIDINILPVAVDKVGLPQVRQPIIKRAQLGSAICQCRLAIFPQLIHLTHQTTKSVFRICFTNRREPGGLNHVKDAAQIPIVAKHMSASTNFPGKGLRIPKRRFSLRRQPDVRYQTLASMLVFLQKPHPLTGRGRTGTDRSV